MTRLPFASVSWRTVKRSAPGALSSLIVACSAAHARPPGATSTSRDQSIGSLEPVYARRLVSSGASNMPISSMWMVIVFGACSRASAMFNVLTVIATFSFLGLGAFAAGGALVAIPTPRSLATER